MEDSASITEREQGLIDFLVRHQGNWVTQVEIASEIGVNKSNVRRIAERLQRRGQPIEIAPDGALRLDMGRYRTIVRLDLHQSAITFLATRLLARYSDKPNIHAVEALLALGKAMVQQKVAQTIGQHIIRVSEDLRQRQGHRLDEKTDYVRNLEKITEAWAGGTKLLLDYQPLHSKALKAHKFQPYFLEPSAIGYSTYVIGKDETLGELRARKLERITGITTLPMETFEIPPDFDPAKLLGGAWGIWFGTEDKQETVRLRFMGADIVRRVKESEWHPSQRITSVTVDELVWEVDIDAPQEMLPWVRGWGASVEVIEPPELRTKVKQGVRQMAQMYCVVQAQAEDPQTARLLRCWGKTSSDGAFHPALFHMMDVAQVAHALLDDAAPRRWRQALAHALNADEARLKDWLPYFVALHDIGKISIPFQAQNEAQLKRMKGEGFIFDGWRKDDSIRHEIVSRVYIESADMPELLRYLSEVISGHHGTFVGREKTRDARNLLRKEHASWHELRKEGDALLRAALLVQLPDASSKPPNISIAVMALTGFMVLCDWVGSDARFFKPTSDESWEDYIGESQRRAEKVVKSSGLFEPVKSDSPATVESLFADLYSLRPLQLAINDVSDDILNQPTLTIIEAPTGEGKTEAALALARRIAQLNGTDEIFYALPTMATSNQMFGRLQRHLHERLRLRGHVKLAHGQSFLVEDDLRAETALADLDPLRNGDSAQALSEARDAMAWFSGKKRALLAPFGVGTVDQI
jgi:CRISPR-associated endonuclease/helicase Cas3